MKVLVPLNSIEHVDDYIEAGAGEFYLGFYDDKWAETFGKYGDLNRLTGFGKDANPYSYEEILKIIENVSQKKIPVYVTFNSSMYSEKQLAMIQTYLPGLKEAGTDGIIVSCLDLVQLGKEAGIPTVASTICGVYNEDIAKVYQKAGAKRIILPRDLSLEEIGEIMRAVPELEYEVFLMRNGCTYSDSNCLGFHRLEKNSVCSSIRNADQTITTTEQEFRMRHQVADNNELYCKTFHNLACGLCAIYQFVQLGVAAGKIVGRSDHWEAICNDIRFAKENMEIAANCHSEEEYLKKMKFMDSSTASCHMGLSCYYPETRFSD